jgi:signal transduction histidine kinase
LVFAVAGPLLIALGSLPLRSSFGLACVLLCALLVVVGVAVIGGAGPALVAVGISLLVGVALFTAPSGVLVFRAGDAVALVAFAFVGAVLGIVVDEFVVLADERGALMALEAALRRVATVVAEGAGPDEVFAAVAEEVGQLLAADFAYMSRYGPDGAVTIIAAWPREAPGAPIGSQFTLGGINLATKVFETGRTERFDTLAGVSGEAGAAARGSGFRSAVGTPIIVEGRRWGVMAVGSSLERGLPEDTELRLVQFTELLATAIGNAESHAGLARLADEQAALRRVATLVARGSPSERVCAAVTEEVGQLLGVASVGMCRYEPDGLVTSVAAWGIAAGRFPLGSHWVPAENNLVTIVFESGRSARVDSFADASGPIGVAARETGFRAAVATPIVVEDRVWGAVVAGSITEQSLPADSEARLASFTELVATAVANAESRTELSASRARIVAAADETRRRIERDLHDRAQQRLVSLMLDLHAAYSSEPTDVDELKAHLAQAHESLADVLDELREISRGIHPAILSQGGLAPALRALARRSPVPVDLELHTERRPPEPVEVAAYYVASEALTNAAKHAHASLVNVELDEHDALMRLAISDDGIGGADPGHGSGLVGLSDRVEALGGTLKVTSPTGGGTTLVIEVPVESRAAAGAHSQ